MKKKLIWCACVYGWVYISYMLFTHHWIIRTKNKEKKEIYRYKHKFLINIKIKIWKLKFVFTDISYLLIGSMNINRLITAFSRDKLRWTEINWIFYI
jgi:hypothetical protein